jgi:LmbE family N-acetylglucosaminyl deacetylase
MLPIVPGERGSPLTILCLGAHSDDIEIGCGGTILRLLDERPGSVVHWTVFAAEGEREHEARSSAAEFLAAAGATHVAVHAFRESFFPFVGDEIKETFEQIKHEVNPELVFTHRREDDHQDHRTIGQLTWNTFRDHLVAEYEIPKYEGDLGHPNLYAPLGALVVERKIDLLHRHFATQHGRAWFRPETFRSLLTLRGIECNSPTGFAEAFHARKLVLDC